MPSTATAPTPPEDLVQFASLVFGDRDRAFAWFGKRAMYLDGQCPIDLLGSPDGVETVTDYLVRIEYGVYS